MTKGLGQSHVTHPPIIDDLTHDMLLSKLCQYCASKYLNNMIEQDRRFIKRQVKTSLGLASYQMT